MEVRDLAERGLIPIENILPIREKLREMQHPVRYISNIFLSLKKAIEMSEKSDEEKNKFYKEIERSASATKEPSGPKTYPKRPQKRKINPQQDIRIEFCKVKNTLESGTIPKKTLDSFLQNLNELEVSIEQQIDFINELEDLIKIKNIKHCHVLLDSIKKHKTYLEYNQEDESTGAHHKAKEMKIDEQIESSDILSDKEQTYDISKFSYTGLNITQTETTTSTEEMPTTSQDITSILSDSELEQYLQICKEPDTSLSDISDIISVDSEDELIL